jgi:hypothetical protein
MRSMAQAYANSNDAASANNLDSMSRPGQFAGLT